MTTAKNESHDAVAGQVDCLVRPVAWWRMSVLPECLPCVTTCAETAKEWQDDGHAVVELGDVAAERERWIAICRDHAADKTPPHKQYEGYADGWLDACNEVMWAGEGPNVALTGRPR
jgi:hypothetical protein